VTRSNYIAEITVSGRALNNEGKPIADATIYLASPRTDPKPLAQIQTDVAGAYRFEAVGLPIQPADTNRGQDAGQFEVFGEADGYAIAWRPAKWFVPHSEHERDQNWAEPQDLPTRFGRKDSIQLDLTFDQPSKLHGRIVDDRGAPVAKTELAIRHCDPNWDQEDFKSLQ
jgi:hypothetical protein